MGTNSQYNNFRPLDAQLIKDVENILSKLNISQTFAIELFYNEIARTGKFPLNIEIPNKETIQAIKDINTHNECQSFNNINSLMEDLND